MIISRLVSYLLISFFKTFPSLYKMKWVRKYFTSNYNSGFLAVGEKWTRFEAIGPEWIFVDIKNCDFPIEFNSTNLLPFEDNSQRLIYSAHMIEHLEPKDLEVFIKECFRVLKPGGFLRFEAPCAQKLTAAYLGENLPLVEYFRNDIIKNLFPVLGLHDKYKQDHIGILGVLSCYIIDGRHVPVYVDKHIFEKNIKSMSLDELEGWLQTLQTPEQKKTHGHNNIIYLQKLEQLAKNNNARRCWEVSYGKTNIPFLHLNNVYRRHKDTIIESPHRTEYSIYFEAQKG